MRRRAIAIHGPPGVGKTALLLTLLDDPDIKKKFAHRIHRVDVGSSVTDVLPDLAALAGALGVERAVIDSSVGVDRLREIVRTKLRDAPTLIVVDDVWQTEAGSPFLFEEPSCVTVITTRRQVIATSLADPTFLSPSLVLPIYDLTQRDGFSLLRHLAPQAITADQATCNKLVEAVGGSPLAIVIMARPLWRAQANPHRIADVLDSLKDTRKRLLLEAKVRTISPDEEREVSLNSAVAVSYRFASDHAELLHGLAVLPGKPNSFSLRLLEFLGGGSSTQALFVLEDDHLVEYADLASTAEPSRKAGDRYWVHQIICSFVEEKLKRTKSLGLVRQKVAEYYVKCADQDTLETVGETQNILTALTWLRQANDVECYLKLAKSHCRKLTAASKWVELLPVATEAAQVAKDSGNVLVYAEIQCRTIAWPLWMRGQSVEATGACITGIEALGIELYDPLPDMSAYPDPVAVNNVLTSAYHNLFRAKLHKVLSTTSISRVDDTNELQQLAALCMRFAEQTGKSGNKTLAESDLAYTLMFCGDYKSALPLFESRLLDAERSNDNAQKSARRLDVAFAYLGLGHLEDATLWLSRAEEFRDVLADRLDIVGEIAYARSEIARRSGDTAVQAKFLADFEAIWKGELQFERCPFASLTSPPVDAAPLIMTSQLNRQ